MKLFNAKVLKLFNLVKKFAIIFLKLQRKQIFYSEEKIRANNKKYYCDTVWNHLSYKQVCTTSNKDSLEFA